jgi:uncharacterized membrane protein
MEKDRERIVTYVSITTILFAVLATLSTFKASGQSTLAVLTQNQASDQWAFYQAKSLKQHTYEVHRDLLRLQPATSDAQRLIGSYETNITRYDREKKEIKEKAETLEQQRTHAQRHGTQFGLAVIFLQLSILLSAIAGLTKRYPLWWSSLAIGAVGIIFFVNGFYLFF